MKVKEALYGEFDVTENRADYIGGSDIPVILGISPFKRRFDLLLEKAKLEEPAFHGNRATEYGHTMEPKIRNFINLQHGTSFVPNRVTMDIFRYHSDGMNGECVLECKTTSDIHATIDGYKLYLVQLLWGMQMNEVQKGILAVYHRPEDYSEEFDAQRLQEFSILMEEHKNLMAHITKEVSKFLSDLERLKENPLLSEEDFLPADNSLISLANKVVQFENQLAMLKEIEQKCKEAKQQLKAEMIKANVKSWQTPNGTKITLVADIPPGTTKMVAELDQAALKAEQPELYQKYLREVVKTTAGRSGYVKITVPR